MIPTHVGVSRRCSTRLSYFRNDPHERGGDVTPPEIRPTPIHDQRTLPIFPSP
jgi:hypothetical protein